MNASDAFPFPHCYLARLYPTPFHQLSFCVFQMSHQPAPASAKISITDFVENIGGHPLSTMGRSENCSPSGQMMMLHFLVFFPLDVKFSFVCDAVAFFVNVFFFEFIYLNVQLFCMMCMCVHVSLPFFHIFHPHHSVCVYVCVFWFFL